MNIKIADDMNGYNPLYNNKKHRFRDLNAYGYVSVFVHIVNQHYLNRCTVYHTSDVNVIKEQCEMKCFAQEQCITWFRNWNHNLTIMRAILTTRSCTIYVYISVSYGNGCFHLQLKKLRDWVLKRIYIIFSLRLLSELFNSKSSHLSSMINHFVFISEDRVIWGITGCYF